MLNDVLGHVVSVLILNELICASMKLIQNRCSSIFDAVFQHALNDTATVWMHRQSLDLAVESLDDELNVLGRNSLDGLLDHVIAILVLDTLQHVIVELFDERGLLINQNVLESLNSQ